MIFGKYLSLTGPLSYVLPSIPCSLFRSRFLISDHASSVVDDPTVQEVAKGLGVDPAQVLISWAVKRDTVVLPKSVTPSRIESNFKEVSLSDKDLEKLNGLERNKRYNVSPSGLDVFQES